MDLLPLGRLTKQQVQTMAAELGVPVVMHPGGAENILKDGALRGRGDLGNIIGNPLETTVATAASHDARARARQRNLPTQTQDRKDDQMLFPLGKQLRRNL